jgi:hypothetical protein
MLAKRIITIAISLLAAAVAAATVVGFWLSYAGLHDFATRNGLAGAEAWAWPGSCDLFILAGELGITISAIRHRKDLAAWGYLVIGFGASVAFNVLHVLPGVLTWGKYAVAAVPPVAAMLALAALMRQVYRLAIEADAAPPEPVKPAAGHAGAVLVPAVLNGAGPDPDATVTFDAIHDIGDQPMRRQ